MINIIKFDNILKILLVLSVCMYHPGINLIHFEGIFLPISVIILFISSLFSERERTIPLDVRYLIAGLLCVCLFSLYSHISTENRMMVMIYIINIFFAIVGFILILQYCESYEQCYKFIILGAILNIIVFGFQKIGYNPILTTTDKVYAGGIMGNLPRMTTYLSIILPIIYFKSFTLFIICICISLFGGQEPQIVILGVGLILLFLFDPFDKILFPNSRRKKIIQISIIVLAIAGLFFYYDSIINSFRVRLDNWGKVLDIYFSKPLIGIGVGVYPFEIGFGKDRVFHSSMLQFLTCGGLFSLFWVCYVIKSNIKRIDISYESISIISLILVSLIEYPFEIKRLWLIIMFMLATFIIKQGDRLNE